MKIIYLNNCLIGVLLLITNFSFGQKIKFNYDAAGNRISRITVTIEEKSTLTDTIAPSFSNKQLNQSLDYMKISVYPNPTSDFIHIQCENITKSACIDANLFSARGELLTSIKLYEYDKTVNLSEYPSGVYYLKIRNNELTESWKIVKQ